MFPQPYRLDMRDEKKPKKKHVLIASDPIHAIKK